MSAFVYSLSHDLSPALMVVGAVMFGAWTVAYVQIVLEGYRQKTYGVPLPSVYLNIAWEAIFSTSIVAPGVVALVWGNRLWFIVDAIIVSQVFLYGKANQTDAWVRKHFHTITVVSIVLSAVGLYHFATYFGDIYGLAASFLMNFSMSVMYIGLLFKRPDLRGLPYGAAWAKMIGTAAGALFCYLWWPLQFDSNGILIRPPHVARPPNSGLLYFLYLTIPLIDALYIHLLRQRRRELAARSPA